MADVLLSEGDDFLESRFDPKYRDLFQEKIGSFGDVVVERDFDIPTKFFGNFDKKTEQVLSNLVKSVFNIADNHGLRIQNSNPRIEFYTESAWAGKESKAKKTFNSLPASDVVWIDGDPHTCVILPYKIDSLEIVIKTIRLLFSNLFGKLYIDELVQSGLYFKTGSSKSIEFELGEKIRFCRFADEYPKQVQPRFMELGRSIKGDKKKVIEFGKKEFFRILEETQQGAIKKDQDFVENTFLFHQAFAQNKPAEFFQIMADKHAASQSEIGLVLPHEKRRFELVQSKKQWAYFESFYEKLQYALNSINDLQECFNLLNDEKELSDFSLSDYWISTLNNRVVFLKRKGLVKLFLVDDAKLTPNQKKDSMEFPLWVWKQRLFRNFPTSNKPEHIIKIISNQYKNSIYQKVFEASFRSINCLKKVHLKTKSELKELYDFKKLKALMILLAIRKQGIEDLFAVSRLVPQMARSNESDMEKVTNRAISSFKQGWSYFISFALIHQYYLDKGDSKKAMAEKFLLIVKKYIDERINNHSSFQVAYLFLYIYQKSGFDLNIPLKIIRKKSKGLEFFLINNDKIMQRNSSNQDIIESNAEKLLQY
ncbi:hypothetical protein KJ966_26020 [bacterium]|nr:hypothetical protein [bacterium]